MITCVVIDDEPPAIEILENHIRKVPFLKHTASYDNPVEAAAALSRQCPDLVFLDVQMPELSGVQLVRLLAGKSKVVFTTAHSQYAVDAYENNVADYLLKPISFERFLKASQRVFESFPPVVPGQPEAAPADDYVFIKSQHKFVRVPLCEIVYLEGLGNYVSLYTPSERFIVHSSLRDLEEKLPAARFIRVHKSYLVSLDHVKSVEGNQITLACQDRECVVPIGEVFRTAFYQLLNRKTVS
ncbi:MAG: LytTR family transcriptional regulator DNA-binding domain-containing protein [Cytophagales bacterium]|nr:LytTR family transcriptional regulator DNA-binding domain-containing protein [Cytophagales bacterium]